MSRENIVSPRKNPPKLVPQQTHKPSAPQPEKKEKKSLGPIAKAEKADENPLKSSQELELKITPKILRSDSFRKIADESKDLREFEPYVDPAQK